MLRNLPMDIINYIIPYTYQPQNKVLMTDVAQYYKSKQIVKAYYYNIWSCYTYINNESVDEDWLSNDLWLYIQSGTPIMRGYHDNTYKIFLRNPRLKTKDDIHKYISKINAFKPMNVINVLWGLLTPYEREDFFIKRQQHLL